MPEMKDLTNKKFKYLTVISLNHKEYGKHGNTYYWKCRCVCGKYIIVSRSSLARGRKSCGCMSKISHYGSDYHGGVKTHGLSKSRIYKIYYKMRERCYSDSDNKYAKDGIIVCQEWLNDFMNFYDWATRHGYKNNLTLDRINNSGNYEPDNCRWATIMTQANNKSNNIIITFNGMTMTLPEWARYLNVSYCTLANRYKRGWSIERMLTEPPRYQKIISS